MFWFLRLVRLFYRSVRLTSSFLQQPKLLRNLWFYPGFMVLFSFLWPRCRNWQLLYYSRSIYFCQVNFESFLNFLNSEVVCFWQLIYFTKPLFHCQALFLNVFQCRWFGVPLSRQLIYFSKLRPLCQVLFLVVLQLFQFAMPSFETAYLV